MDVQISGPIPVSPRDPMFGAVSRAVRPYDLEASGYVEEEYFLSGTAHRYEPGLLAEGEPFQYTTRLVIRRPAAESSGVTFVSVLNASQGYDVEDDWRRSWDWLLEQRHTYVGVTLKPISIEALRSFNPTRYATLSWQVDGRPPRPAVTASPGWDPWQVVAGCEEGLAWDILVDLAEIVRRPGLLPDGSRRVFLMGQSQSGVYVNTFAAEVHARRRQPDGSPLYDGYLPGVSAVLTRPLTQQAGGVSTWSVGPAPDLDVPVIRVTADGDLDLYEVTNKAAPVIGEDRLPVRGSDPYARGLGDGPMSRHYQVAATPHSDARSPMIPQDDDLVRSGRLARDRTQALVERLNPIPLEPVITGAMASMVRWVDDGIPAPPSRWFDQEDGLPNVDEYGITRGGLRLGLVEHPLATFRGASAEDPKYGGAELFSIYDVTSRYGDRDSYVAACDAVDDDLEAQGYLEPVGRRLLRRITEEVWDRVTLGTAARWSTPQGDIPLR